MADSQLIVNRRRLTHGMRNTPEYSAWKAMKHRCLNPRNHVYRLYGGAGITVCERWRKFEHFIADMGRKPSDKHTLDRYPNQKGNYEPGNCRWATMKEQQNNRSNNRLIEWRGETHTVSEWASILKISYQVIWRRLNEGWSTDNAFSLPVDMRYSHSAAAKHVSSG